MGSGRTSGGLVQSGSSLTVLMKVKNRWFAGRSHFELNYGSSIPYVGEVSPCMVPHAMHNALTVWSASTARIWGGHEAIKGLEGRTMTVIDECWRGNRSEDYIAF